MDVVKPEEVSFDDVTVASPGTMLLHAVTPGGIPRKLFRTRAASLSKAVDPGAASAVWCGCAGFPSASLENQLLS